MKLSKNIEKDIEKSENISCHKLLNYTIINLTESRYEYRYIEEYNKFHIIFHFS